MKWQFQKHYSVEEARALLPEIRQWLARLQEIKGNIESLNQRLAPLVKAGNDIGGASVDKLVRLIAELNGRLERFRSREIQIKDIDRGLLDFPAIIGGREVFLCWEQDEDDIEFWHDIDAGYAGRERL